MRVLVTGAAGFLGSHLTDRLLQEGFSVLGMDNLITGSLENIAHLENEPHFDFIEHDVSKYIDVPGGLDGIFHFASPVVARATSEALELDVRVARFFPLVGPGQRDVFALPSFCRRAFRIKRGGVDSTMHVGNLDVYRDFTDVRDGIMAMARLADLDQVRHRVYNICCGEPTSVRQLLQLVFDIAGIAPDIVMDKELIRADEPEQIVGDPSRIEEETGWQAELDLRRTVDDTFHWMTQFRPT